MAIYKVNAADLTSVANAIRVKGETSASLQFPEEFITAISNIDLNPFPTYTPASSSAFSFSSDTSGNWEIKFTGSVSDFRFTKLDQKVDIFCVGGGGGGAQVTDNNYRGGGGGGGGKTTTSKAQTLSLNTQYSISIGAGGAAGGAGGTTTAFGVSAGGGSAGSGSVGGAGGSGGGAGGFQRKDSYAYRAAGQGGTNGGAGVGNASWSGGSGQGTTTRPFGGSSGIIYSGGGGGGRGSGSGSGEQTSVPAAGGEYGGGAGGGSGASAINNGLPNTGGGGGGGKYGKIAGFAGGSGVVIIRNTR